MKITRVEAVKLVGHNLPYHMNYYLLTGLQFYPTYADWSTTFAGNGGLIAVVGRRKAQAESEAA